MNLQARKASTAIVKTKAPAQGWTKTRLILSALSVSIFLNHAELTMAETLQDALVATYNNNPQLQAERARLREIDETYIQARAQGRLSANISADTGFTRSETTQSSFFGGATKTISNLKPHSAQVQFVQPLYQGGRVAALKRQAEAGILSGRESLRNIEQSVFLAAATAYADVIRDEQIAKIRRTNVRVLDQLKVASEERFRLGDGTKTDIAQSQSRIAGAEIGLAQADAQLASSRALFIEAIGYNPENLAPIPEFQLPESLKAAKRLAGQNNPRLIAAIFNEAAGKAAISVAKSAYRPTISLNGVYSASEDQSINALEGKSTSIVAQLNIPIFAGGLNGSRVRSAEHASTRLSFETRAAERLIDRQISQLWGQLDASQRSLRASQIKVEAAQTALEGVQFEKTVGTRTTLEVLDAEEELLTAQLNTVQAKRNLDVIHFQFLVLLGAFDAESLRLPTDYYMADENFRAVKLKGRDQLVDRYVPEFAQKIGGQLPNIPKDIAGVISDTQIPQELKKNIESIAKSTGEVGSEIKETIDKVTLQTPEYGSSGLDGRTPKSE